LPSLFGFDVPQEARFARASAAVQDVVEPRGKAINCSGVRPNESGFRGTWSRPRHFFQKDLELADAVVVEVGVAPRHTASHSWDPTEA
jgi:hypothetical protein